MRNPHALSLRKTITIYYYYYLWKLAKFHVISGFGSVSEWETATLEFGGWSCSCDQDKMKKMSSRNVWAINFRFIRKTWIDWAILSILIFL